MSSQRSVKASKDGLEKVKQKFKLTNWDQSYLAGTASCSRPTVSKFLAGQSIDRVKFEAICDALDIPFADIVDLDHEKTDSVFIDNINDIVISTRNCLKQYINDKCGKMRVLDMTYPIGVSQIYTDVNILKKITGTKWIEIAELQKRVTSDKRNFDRLSGGTVEKRVLGEDAVNLEHKLVVLGKPGSGKTTFLKHLAIQCLNGKFQSLRIPIFITLKDYSENEENISILDFIKKELICLVNEIDIDRLISQGRVLILLDGLDEVKEEEQERVCEQIEKFTSNASKLTEDFRIDREFHYKERNKLKDILEKIEANLLPKENLEKKISYVKLKEVNRYKQNIKRIEENIIREKILFEQLKDKEDELEIMDIKEHGLIFHSIQKIKKEIQKIKKEIENLKKDQENKKKDIYDIAQKLNGLYTESLNGKNIADYKVAVQEVVRVSRERLIPDIKKLREEIKPIQEKLKLDYPDLDEYLDKGLSFLSKKFPDRIYQNRFVVTCRIALRGINFTDFTSVEVADFDEHQIRNFSKNWFNTRAENKEENGYKIFMEKLSQNESVQELANSPLLLTLLCLVFEDAGDFPKNRSHLYKEGISILLKKWDAGRLIYRRKSEKEIYKELSSNRKEDLFSTIACEMFEKGMYFFNRTEVEGYIAEYIKNLPNAKNNPELLRSDSEEILTYIELQHGLLVERAKGIYSFSHLTFQEYFTARKIVDTSNPANLDKKLRLLASHISEKNWREVFLLAIGMSSDAGYLLTLMKKEIDIMIAGNPLIQKILIWVNKCTENVNTPYKRTAVRAFYLKYAYDIALVNSSLDIDKMIDIEDVITPILDNKIDSDLVLAAGFLGSRLHEANNRFRSRRDDPQFVIEIMNSSDERIFELLAISDLRNLKEALPKIKDKRSFNQWWLSSGKQFDEKVAQISQFPNINHEFKFNPHERNDFSRYYYSNVLLIECLYSDCFIEEETRKKIEDRLFIPLANLEETEEILIGTENNYDNKENIRVRWSKKNEV